MVERKTFLLMWLSTWLHLQMVSSFAPTQKRFRAFQSCTIESKLFSWQLYARGSRKRFNSKQPLRFTALEPSIQSRLNNGTNDTDVVLLVDANNVRGVDGFKLTTFDLILSLASWRRSLGMQKDSVVCIIDHGSRPNAYSLDGITLVFAGPNRTADDVIAHDCQWFAQDECKPHVFITTSDRELRSRCLRTRRYSPNKRNSPQVADKGEAAVEVFASLHLASLLKRHWEEAMETTFTGANDYDELLDALLKSENDIRAYQRPSLRNRREKRKAKRGAPRRKTSDPTEKETHIGDSEGDFKLQLAPLGNQDFPEHTWHRVVIAEHLRQLLARQTPTSVSEVEQNGHMLQAYQAMHNRFTGSPVSLGYDQRIRHHFYSQQSLRRYLNQSAESIGVMDLVERGYYHAVEESQLLEDSLDSNDTAESIMRDIVRVSGQESQYQIVNRYTAQAPAHLQLRRSRDVKKLLKRVAAKERRAPDYTPRWYLLPEESAVSP